MSNKELVDLLIEALPLVEFASDDRDLTPAGRSKIRGMAKRIRKAIKDGDE